MSYSTVLSLDRLGCQPLSVPCEGGKTVKALWPFGFTPGERMQIRYFLERGIWRMGREVQWLDMETLALNHEEDARLYDRAIRPERVKKNRRKSL